MIPAPGTPMREKRVLLLNLNRYDQPSPVYPIGLAYVAGALRSQDYDTRIWDVRASGETLEACISAYDPGYVGISLRNIDNVQLHNPKSFVHELVEFCRRVRAATASPLILGGSGFSVFPRELYALTGVDFGIEGEGEHSLLGLIEALRRGASVEAVEGLHYRTAAGEIRTTGRTNSRMCFDTKPWHEPGLLKRYVAEGALPGVQTQRGCPLKCCYCTYPQIEGRLGRYRTGSQVVDDMRALAEHGVKYAFIVDSVFNTSPGHVRKVCEALVEAKTGVEWECFLRPTKALDRELLELMRAAGMRHIEFGSDSFSDSVLEAYGKGFRFEEIAEVSRLARELELHYSHFLILGGPGETEATVAETLQRAASLQGAFFFATIGMRIYPNTPLWQRLKLTEAGENPADYLAVPRFFLENGMSLESIQTCLKEVAERANNWIFGDPPERFMTTMEKLRRRGIQGPMWEYVELLKRMERA